MCLGEPGERHQSMDEREIGALIEGNTSLHAAGVLKLIALGKRTQNTCYFRVTLEHMHCTWVPAESTSALKRTVDKTPIQQRTVSCSPSW